jgi:hypothetical protein
MREMAKTGVKASRGKPIPYWSLLSLPLTLR